MVIQYTSVAIVCGVLVIIGILILAVIYLLSTPKELAIPTKFVVFISIYVALATLALIPADVAITSDHNRLVGFRIFIEVGYYVSFALVLILALIIMPFTFFYNETALDPNVSIGQKIVYALKRTIIFIIFALFILVFAILVGIFNGYPTYGKDSVKAYLYEVVYSENLFQEIISYAFFTFAIFGFLSWCYYTVDGLAAVPILFIRGVRDIEEERKEAERKLFATQKVKSLIAKDAKDEDDVMDIEELGESESLLKKKIERLDKIPQFFAYLQKISWPFRWIIGGTFYTISLFIVCCLVLTQIIGIIFSDCGWRCGFTLTHPDMYSPIDLILTYSAKVFPLDYVLFSVLILYLFLATAVGITNIGIKIAFIEIYSIRFRKTDPQGLLIGTFFLIVTILALVVELKWLCPQYLAYGGQTYTLPNGKTSLCSMQADYTECPMTVISQMLTVIFVTTPWLGLVYFIGTWVFIAAFCISSVIACFVKQKSIVARTAEDMEHNYSSGDEVVYFE